MCNCISYNQPQDYQVDKDVVLINMEMTGKDSVCIDACIAMDINLLWDNKIPTLSCCCGHNIRNKSVIVKKQYAKVAKDILPDFDVMYWDKCLLNIF